MVEERLASSIPNNLIDKISSHPDGTSCYPPLSEVPAIILAGGHQSRMKSRIPKHLIPVTPSLRSIDFPMQILTQAGVRTIYLSCVNDNVDYFNQFLKESREKPGFGDARCCVLDEPKGVIPALGEPIQAYRMEETPVIVIHGDEVVSVDLDKMYEQHKALNSLVTMCVANNREAVNKIYFAFDPILKRIIKMQIYPEDTPIACARKAGFTHTMTGLWIIQPEKVRDLVISPDSHSFVTSCFRRGELFAYPTGNFFLNLNTQEQIHTARKRLHQLGFR